MAATGMPTRFGSISQAVNAFYNENPFPGYDINKYNLREDLYRNANPYALLVDAQIPWGARIADVGCGTGQLACLLSLKDRHVEGYDFSDASVELASSLKARLCLENVRFTTRNIFDLTEPDEKFDYVFCNGVLHHTPDPYGAFRKLVPMVKPGGYIVVGLYNLYGRLFLRLKRTLVNWWYRSNRQAKRQAIQEMLVKEEDDTFKQDSWYADQYQHPHESVHTIGQLLRWYRLHDIAYVNSMPPIELWRPEGAAQALFDRSRAADCWRNSGVAHLHKQFGWIISLRKTGGYYVIVGRKSEREPAQEGDCVVQT